LPTSSRGARSTASRHDARGLACPDATQRALARCVVELLLELPEAMRREALTTIGALMVDPLPLGSETYPEVPDTHRLVTGYVTIFYRLLGDEIDIVHLRPNS
jgi:hypothetical protein